MASCVDRCCFGQGFCNSNAIKKINIAGYHQVCDQHYENVKLLDSLQCRYCGSVCKITLDLLPPNIIEVVVPTKECPTCHFKVELQSILLKSCGHEHCTNCMNDCQKKSKSTVTNSKFPVCPNCSNNIYSDIDLKCKHKGCYGCYNAECKECKKIAKPAHSNSRFPVCPNCSNNIYRDIDLKCKHKGCYGCYSAECKECKILKSQCRNCKKENCVPVELECKHQGCILCVNDPYCKECNNFRRNYENSYQLTKKCENCLYHSVHTILGCGHTGCGRCSVENECYACSLIQKCSNCKEFDLSPNWNGCKHKICYRCLGKAQKCKKCFFQCIRCENYFNNLIESICHNCYNKTPDAHQCYNCKLYKYPISNFEYCQHKICTSCENIVPKCFECFSICNICRCYFNKADLLEHATVCNQCVNKRDRNELCVNCGSSNIFYNWNSCIHKICVNCSKNQEKCKNCFIKCKECQNYFKENQLNRETIICLDCSKKHNNLEACDSCQMLKNNLINTNCYHKICIECKNQKKNCLKCTFCQFCGSNTVLQQLICGHEACRNCSKNKMCVRCLIEKKNENVNNGKVGMCWICKKQIYIIGVLLCGHNICFNCANYEIQVFDYKCHLCSLNAHENYCISCKSRFRWGDYEDIYHKPCCNKFFCMICRNFRDNHKCNR